MADVSIVDIDGEQWNIKDVPLTQKVNNLTRAYFLQIPSIAITTATNTGFRSTSQKTNIPYNPDMEYIVNINTLENVRAYISRQNSAQSGYLDYILTCNIQCNLSNVSLSIIGVKR